MEHKDEKTVVKGAKLELTARFILPDGRVIERQATADEIPSLEEYDMGDVDKFLATYDKYERGVIDARNRLTQSMTDAISDELKKTKPRKG